MLLFSTVCGRVSRHFLQMRLWQSSPQDFTPTESRITGDRYGGDWPAERFRAHGVAYEPAEKAKSEIYLSMLPIINSQRCDLLDNARLTAELNGLEGERRARDATASIIGPAGTMISSMPLLVRS